MIDPRATLLIVEDDAVTRTFLGDNLTADGFDVLVADCARDAWRLIETKAPDLVIVDVGLPDGSGLDLIARVRATDRRISRADPDQRFLVLSGRASEVDRLRGLTKGADDYVVKPFSYAELLLRVRALLRRGATVARSGRLRVGELEVDPVTRDVHLRGARLDLSSKEFALLRALATDPARVFTKEELLRDVWGFRSLGTTRTLDSHACRLRRKLGVQGDRYIHNVWGVGYRLVDPVSAVAA
jgi:DNA-binding response OmpR family regulator